MIMIMSKKKKKTQGPTRLLGRSFIEQRNACEGTNQRSQDLPKKKKKKVEGSRGGDLGGKEVSKMGSPYKRRCGEEKEHVWHLERKQKKNRNRKSEFYEVWISIYLRCQYICKRNEPEIKLVMDKQIMLGDLVTFEL